jgi:hypothetical protein
MGPLLDPDLTEYEQVGMKQNINGISPKNLQIHLILKLDHWQ